MVPDTIAPGAIFGCPDQNLELEYRWVVEVIGPAEVRLTPPAHRVRTYDRHAPGGRDECISEVQFDDSDLPPLTRAEADRRIAVLRSFASPR